MTLNKITYYTDSLSSHGYTNELGVDEVISLLKEEGYRNVVDTQLFPNTITDWLVVGRKGTRSMRVHVAI